MEGEATNAPFLRKDERFKSILLMTVMIMNTLKYKTEG